MPVDGSYGRLSAHRQRFHELRRKKLERRERKLLQNRIKTPNNSSAKLDSEDFDSTNLEQLKKVIRKKARTQIRNEILLIVLSIILGFIIVYFFYKNMTN